MTDFYGQNPRFYVGVDCIIFGLDHGQLSILLTKRGFEPEIGKWSLQGGFVRENESVDDAARRVLFNLTGLENVYMEQVHTFGQVERDPGARVVSVAYYALLGLDDLDPIKAAKHGAVWHSVESLPSLSFDHPEMIEEALVALRRKCTSEPVAFKLLPDHFTLTQLQNLYELILGEHLDKRNFRKRIAENECIEKTELIDKSGSRRGASLFRYNPETYKLQPKFKL